MMHTMFAEAKPSANILRIASRPLTGDSATWWLTASAA